MPESIPCGSRLMPRGSRAVFTASTPSVVEGLERRVFLSAVALLPAVQYPVGQASSAGRQVAVGDFNNDGKPDLLETNQNDSVVSLLLNKGGGVFAKPLSIDTAGPAAAVAVGDFNHDGANDVAVGVSGNGVDLQVFMGLGDGWFNVPANYSLGGATPGSIAVADFNADGRLDLAMTAFPVGAAVIMINSGNGAFEKPVDYPIQGSGTSVIVDDFNGDRAWDLAVAGDNIGSTGTLNVLYGNTIVDPRDSQSLIPDGTFSAADHYPIGSLPIAIAPGFPDFNGDHIDDLAVANANSGTVSVLAGNSIGEFGVPNDIVFGSGLDAVGAGIFTQSGHVDLAAAVDTNVKIRLGNGDGSFQLPAQSFPLGSASTGPLLVTDLNGDGKPDIVATNTTGLAVLLSGTGDTAAPSAVLAAPLTAITAPRSTPYTFSVKFTDNKAVNAATLATGAIRVTGPHMYSQLATLVSVDVAGNGTPRTATYRITPTADAFDASMNGLYTVSLVGGKVADTSGNFAAGATLGTFSINITVGSISGIVFNDTNANGVNDPGEARPANVRVYIDANKNGVFDSATEKSVLSDGMGGYILNNLAPGTYRIREVTPTGNRISAPTGGFYDITLAATQNIAGKNFGNTTHPLLSGTIFNDANSDGVRQAAETGLASWRVFIDANKNGVLDPTELRTLTDAAGNYAFTGLAAGTYRVREETKAGFRRTSPAAGFYDVTLGAGAIAGGKSFGDTTHVLISGTVFNDANANKLRDTVKGVAEAGLANWRIYIDAKNNGVFDASEVSTLTDAAGNWAFKTLAARAAAYVIRIAPQSGWTRTTPTTGTPAGGFSIALPANGTSRTGLLFGEKHL